MLLSVSVSSGFPPNFPEEFTHSFVSVFFFPTKTILLSENFYWFSANEFSLDLVVADSRLYRRLTYLFLFFFVFFCLTAPAKMLLNSDTALA